MALSYQAEPPRATHAWVTCLPYLCLVPFALCLLPFAFLDRFHPLAHGRDRLDELPVSVIVPLLQELLQRPVAIRGFVVRPAELEGSYWIVIGPDDEHAGESGQG